MKQKWNLGACWGIIYPILLYNGMAYLIQIIIINLSSILLFQNNPEFASEFDRNHLAEVLGSSVNSEIMYMQIFAGLTCIPICILIMHYDKLKEKAFGIYVKYRENCYLNYALLIPLGFSSMLMGNMLVSLLTIFMSPESLEDFQKTSDIIMESSLAVQLIMAAVIAPIIEELIFRGIVLNRIKFISGTKVAIVFSAMLFGVFHMNLVQCIYGFVMGLILGYVYDKYKSILAPMILHATANFISIMLSSTSQSDTMSQVQSTSYSVEEIIMMLQIMGIAGVVTVILLILMNKIEKPEIVEQ